MDEIFEFDNILCIIEDKVYLTIQDAVHLILLLIKVYQNRTLLHEHPGDKFASLYEVAPLNAHLFEYLKFLHTILNFHVVHLNPILSGDFDVLNEVLNKKMR